MQVGQISGFVNSRNCLTLVLFSMVYSQHFLGYLLNPHLGLDPPHLDRCQHCAQRGDAVQRARLPVGAGGDERVKQCFVGALGRRHDVGVQVDI